MKLLLALVVVAVATAGCGSSDEPSTEVPLVVFSQTGGVAGIDERLEIETDGAATVTIGEPANEERAFELTEAELDRVESLLEAADFDALPTPPEETGCADCFVYTVEHDGETISYDDVTEPPESVADLVAALTELVDTHQPAAAGYIKGG